MFLLLNSVAQKFRLFRTCMTIMQGTESAYFSALSYPKLIQESK